MYPRVQCSVHQYFEEEKGNKAEKLNKVRGLQMTINTPILCGFRTPTSHNSVSADLSASILRPRQARKRQSGYIHVGGGVGAVYRMCKLLLDLSEEYTSLNSLSSLANLTTHHSGTLLYTHFVFSIF